MTLFMRAPMLASLTLTFMTLAFSCGDDHPDHSGNTACQELGEYCHDPGEIDAAAEECHQEMHEAAEGCEERLDECRAICEAVIEGAGGAGSGGAGSGGAAGSGHVGNVECQELGSYCHDPGEIDEAAQECHEFMHEAAEGCEDRLVECRAICQAVIEASGGAGGGGTGGAGGSG